MADEKALRTQAARGKAAETLKRNRYREAWFEGLRRQFYELLEGLSLDDDAGRLRVQLGLGILRRLEENMDRDIANGGHAAKTILGLADKKEGQKGE